MAYTQAQLDALQAALASGTLRVQYEDRSVVFRSLEELKQTIQIVSQSVNSSSASPSRSFAKFSKG